MKQNNVLYGPGGYDPTKPNNNVIEEYEVEVPDPIPTPEERIAELEAALDTVTLALLEVLA
jgi:hypothetical protein